MNTWIFQGNPKVFNVDAYLRQFRVILWMVRQEHLAQKMQIGDVVYLWRSDAGEMGSGGIIAHGALIDLPKMLSDEEAAQFYSAPIDAKPTLRAKILLDSIQLHPPKLTRLQLKDDPILAGLSILRMANSTNFEVGHEQARRLEGLYFTDEQEPETSDETDAAEFPEGRQAFVIHKKRERNPALIRAAKSNALKLFGKLTCQACGFDFGRTYGRFGEGYIEAHHTVPVSELNGESVSRIEDIALVCSNCHRVLHRRRPWLNIDELKMVLTRQIVG